MIKGNLALINEPEKNLSIYNEEFTDIVWSWEDYWQIIEKLKSFGCEYVKGREEYTLFKEIVVSKDVTQVAKLGNHGNDRNPVFSKVESSGVISPFYPPIVSNDTPSKSYKKPFLAPLDIHKSGSIADVISSFKVIQSDSMSLNIGFDTEFQDYRNGSIQNRRVLSLQMSIEVGETLIRYFSIAC